MKYAVAPIQLGCCPDAPRCRLCAPPPPPPEPGWIGACIEDARGRTDRPVVAHFFGGPPPTDAMLAEAAGVEISVSVRPDLLDRAGADRLRRAGVRTVELDALTFDRQSLRGIGRRYSGERVEEMADGLVGMGFEVGLVLALGLPGSTHDSAVADAARSRSIAQTVRLHPVLVLRGSGLWEAHLDGFYEPLSLGQAITTCRAMMDVLEPAGVRVIRVGRQPGPDGIGRAVAGPRHSSLRELVEARRTLDRLRGMLREAGLSGGGVVIRCASVDETRTRGPRNDNVRTLRAEFRLGELRVRADPGLDRGQIVLEAS